MIDFRQLIDDLRGHGIGNIEIAENMSCDVQLVSRIYTGRKKREIEYTPGKKLVDYHRRVCEQAFKEEYN